MKFFLPLILVLLLSSSTSYSTETKSFPLVILGKTVNLGSKSDYQTVSASLQAILSPNDESLSSPERIQYDVIATDGPIVECKSLYCLVHRQLK